MYVFVFCSTETVALIKLKFGRNIDVFNLHCIRQGFYKQNYLTLKKEKL